MTSFGGGQIVLISLTYNLNLHVCSITIIRKAGTLSLIQFSLFSYQYGPDTYLLQVRDADFPARLREYLSVARTHSAEFKDVKVMSPDSKQILYNFCMQFAFHRGLFLRIFHFHITFTVIFHEEQQSVIDIKLYPLKNFILCNFHVQMFYI